MRTKKALLGIMMTIAVTAAAVGCGTAPAPAQSEKTTAAGTETASQDAMTASQEAGSDWYQAYLTDPGTKEKYSHYKLVDIDNDGVPELFLSTRDESFITSDDEACLIVLKDGKPEAVSTIGRQAGDIYYVNQSAGTLTHFSRLSGEEHIEVFKLENGALTLEGTADYYAQNHGKNESNEPLYLLNDKEVTEEEYNAYYEPNTQESNAVTYDAIQ